MLQLAGGGEKSTPLTSRHTTTLGQPGTRQLCQEVQFVATNHEKLGGNFT